MITSLGPRPGTRTRLGERLKLEFGRLLDRRCFGVDTFQNSVDDSGPAVAMSQWQICEFHAAASADGVLTRDVRHGSCEDRDLDIKSCYAPAFGRYA
jgi:hypothetical protein